MFVCICVHSHARCIEHVSAWMYLYVRDVGCIWVYITLLKDSTMQVDPLQLWTETLMSRLAGLPIPRYTDPNIICAQESVYLHVNIYLRLLYARKKPSERSTVHQQYINRGHIYISSYSAVLRFFFIT